MTILIGLIRGIYMNTEKLNLLNFLNSFNRIVIPDIQRDYVMGSGGFDKIGNNKLKSLLKAMEGREDAFNFSCIMGHSKRINGENIFYVYDGQQRIVTLVYLAAYIAMLEGDKKYNEQLCKFSFFGRDSANEYLRKILAEETKETELEIEDFTTFSIDNLYNEFFDKNNKAKYKNINLDFLMTNVEFDLIIVDEAGDAEQFFMDLNDGLMLEEYEIYKAELNNKINGIYKGDYKFRNWALKIDNEWLEYFLPYKTDKCCEEEAEINFIRFCFRMIYIERYGNEKDHKKIGIKWIIDEDVQRVYSIMNNLVEIELKIIDDKKYLNFSWDYEYHKGIRGAYWSLKDINYTGMLKCFLLNINNFEKIQYDVLIWCFLSNLGLEKDKLNEYLRFIKKLLNANRLINKNAYYDRSREIWYCRYSVFGIPDYYGNLVKIKHDENHKKYILDVVTINGYLKCLSELNINALLKFLNRHIESGHLKFGNSKMNEIINREALKYNSSQYEEIRKFEDLRYFNGLVDNIFDDDNELIIKFSDFEQKVKMTNNKNFTDKYIITKIFKNISNVVSNFDDITIDNITIEWPTYFDYNNYEQRYSSESYCRLPFQCLTDCLTHYNEQWKKILQMWLKSEYGKTATNSNSNLYLKYYKFIPKSWCTESDLICYPDTDGEGRNFLSINSNRYNPIIRFESIEKWINEGIYRIIPDGQNDIAVIYKNQKIQKTDMPWNIWNHYGWLTELAYKGYKEILCSSDIYEKNYFLQNYIENNQNGLSDIKDCIEKYTAIIRFIGGHYYFFTRDCLENFIANIEFFE